MIKEMRKHLKNRHFVKNIIFFLAGIFVLMSGFVVLWLATLKIPDFSSFEERKVINSTKIYDRTGQVVLYDINKDIKRTSVPFADMGEIGRASCRERVYVLV